MGAVFEAVQQPIGRRVAIKVLHPEFAHDREVLKRFFNEARAANLISHPSIVQVSDYGQLPNGSAYLVMEFLNGATLDERLEASGGCLSSEEAQHITWQLASALGDWCETPLCERGEYGLGEGGDARESLGWGWILRNAGCRRILREFWVLLGAASG